MSPLRLDHASLAVAQFPSALAELGRLGFEVTPTPAAPGRHGRLFLDRAYLEVSERAEVSGPRHAVPLFFFRFDDREQTAAALAGRGVRSRARSYTGLDGEWEELELLGPPAMPLPILVRRTMPVELARDWPPGRSGAQPNGARTLNWIVLQVADVAEAADFFERLFPEAKAQPGAQPALAERSVEIGPVALVRAGAAGARVAGVEFGVSDLAATAGFLEAAGVRIHRAGEVLWIDPDACGGVLLGFRPEA